jgi:large subunit ribosomal protein L2
MKTYKPTTPSRRKMTTISYRGTITTNDPYKPLTRGFSRGTGRNAFGRITSGHKGSGHKRSYRDIDFVYDKMDIPAKLQTIEYDPNRSAFIALAAYRDGAKRYVVVPKSMKVGDTFVVSEKADLVPGNRTALKNIPVGTFIYNIEIKPGNGAKMVRSAGSFAQVTAHNDGRTQLKMPSGEIRTVSEKCYASIGSVSNPDYHLVTLGKAGRSRWLGIRPTVRGSAMNPVDHPHGGGEGRQGIGLRRGPKTRYGKQAYGVRTRTPKKYSNYAIVTRRKTKRNPD